MHMRADMNGPIGIVGQHMNMGDHMHMKGEVMVSFRYMYMDMEGNRIGKDRVSPDFIVQNVPNRFFGLPGQPPTLRIVPLSMTMEMAMLGAMWAMNDWVTIMGMGSYVSKEMDHVTYAGPAGTNVLGNFTTKASGLGDTYLGAMIRLFNQKEHKLHFNLGLTAPTGSTTETDTVLTPMNMTPTVRLPYAMQLGSGTWDVKPGLTYNVRAGDFTWGFQWMGTFRLGDDNGYSWGDTHQVTGWAAWGPRPWFSGSLRVEWLNADSIDGIDPNIIGPVQTADPDKYGGDWLFGYVGVNLLGQSGWVEGHRLAFEAGWPIEQDLNGPQMETDFRLMAGWQYSF